MHQRSGGMPADESDEPNGADLMSAEHGDGGIGHARQQCRNGPDEKSERFAGQKRSGHSRDWLQEKQRIKRIFTERNDPAMHDVHAIGERRKAGVRHAPRKPQAHEHPDGKANRAVHGKDQRPKRAVADDVERKSRRDQRQHQDEGQPVNAYRDEIETAAQRALCLHGSCHVASA